MTDESTSNDSDDDNHEVQAEVLTLPALMGIFEGVRMIGSATVQKCAFSEVLSYLSELHEEVTN